LDLKGRNRDRGENCTVINFTACIIHRILLGLGYGLDDRGSRVRFSAEAGNFSLHQRVQTGAGDQPASYPMGTICPFPGGKAVGA
jgi:hypothetical protein